MPCLIHRPLASMLPPRPPLSTLFPYTTLFRSRLGHEQSLAHEPFPVADPELLVEETVTCVVQVAGKLRSEEHTSELQSRGQLVCRLLLEKKTTPESLTMETRTSTLSGNA